MKRIDRIKRLTAKWAARLSYALAVATIVWPAKALAAVAAGGALPWDTPLTTLQNDLQGPVAHAVTTAAIIGVGLRRSPDRWSCVRRQPRGPGP